MQHSESYRLAFERLVSETEGDADMLNMHADVLISYATTGDYQGKSIMANLVPESAWSWPAYDEQIGIATYKTRCGWFLRRLATYAFSMDSISKMKSTLALGIHLKVEFDSGNPKNTPQACLDAHGRIVDVDDQECINKAPCERLTCSCTWLTHMDFTKPITPSGFTSDLKSTIKTGRKLTNEELRAQAEEFCLRKGLSPGMGLPTPNKLATLIAIIKYRIKNLL